MITNSCTEIAPVIVRIFNKMIESGVYPESLKIQKTIPVPKSGSKRKIENYRPIAILPIINKCIEKQMYFKRITKHIEDNNFLYLRQFGFRRGTGTLDACVDIINNICEIVYLRSNWLGAFSCTWQKLLILLIIQFF